MKKKIILSSALTIAMCASLVTGATYALFSSESTLNVAVTSGTVEVLATAGELTLTSRGESCTNGTFANGGTATNVDNEITLAHITPGDKVEFDITVTNNSNVDIQYRTIIGTVEDNGLFSGLEVSIDGLAYTGGTTVYGKWTELAKESSGEIDVVPVSVELPYLSVPQNQYQNKTCKLYYKVEAVQGNADVADPWTGELPAGVVDANGEIDEAKANEYIAGKVETSTETDANGKKFNTISVDNAADLQLAMMNLSKFDNYTVKLEKNIDLNGQDWIPGVVNAYDGATTGNVSRCTVTIDGQGHFISGMNDMFISGGTQGGMNLVIKDLTITNASVQANKSQAGAAILVGHLDGGMKNVTISNCKVVDSTIDNQGDSWTGAIIGYAAGYNGKDGPCFLDITLENCTVSGNTIIGNGSTGGIIGHATGSEWTKVTMNNCVVTDNAITCIDDSKVKAGSVMGTIGNAGHPSTQGGVTYTGGVFVNNLTESDNTVVSYGETITGRIYGRQGNVLGILWVDGEIEVGTAAFINGEMLATTTNVGGKAVNNIDALKGYDAEEIEVVIYGETTLKGGHSSALGSANTKKIVINGHNANLTLTVNYMPGFYLNAGDAKLVLNDLTVTSVATTAGTWDVYDIQIACAAEMNNVTFEKAVAIVNGDKTTMMNNVTINETHDYYALWIEATGQTVEIDGLTINSAGRGIKIDEQYVGAPAKVTLKIANATFATASKAAVMVKSAAGADIVVGKNVDISAVAKDTVNVVWVDEDASAYYDLVTVTNATKVQE